MNKIFKIYKNFHNIIDFYIRNKLNFSRGKYIIENESKKDLFNEFELEKRKILIKKELLFREKYELNDFYKNSPLFLYQYNLLIIELLEKYIEKNEEKSLEILDIGSKNWEYLFGEYYFFKNGNKEKELSIYGIELDAYRRYKNLYTRYDYAISFTEKLKKSKYIVGDFMEHNGSYDYILCFFPFIIPSPLIHWGLPLKFLRPMEMLKHAYSLLKEDGILLISNQYSKEYELQSDYLKQLEFNFEKKGEFISNFMDQKRKWFITIVRK
jgi:hypothetical protein